MFRLIQYDPPFEIGEAIPKVVDAKYTKLKAPFQVQYTGTKPKTFQMKTDYDATTKLYTYTDKEYKYGDMIDMEVFAGITKTQLTNVTTVRDKFTLSKNQLDDM